MANFNLNDYETVEERLRRFWADEAHQDARIVTQNQTSPEDRKVGMWIVQAFIFMNRDDQAAGLPKATGLAFEIDGQGMANKTSALENCETSAIGRALANMNLSGNKRTSREEMEKVARGVEPAKLTVVRDWEAELAAVSTEAEAMKLFQAAQQAGAHATVLAAIKAKGKGFAKA